MDFYFTYRIYFETSFLLPSDLSKERLQEAVDFVVTTHFGVFLSLIDEEKKCGYISDEKTRLCLEEMSGDTINSIHEEVISLCKSDTKNGFRLFWAIDRENTHFLVIHCHHGVADGFMITNFAHSLFCNITNRANSSVPKFVIEDPVRNEGSIKYPELWSDSQNVAPPTVYPKRADGDSDEMVNIERVVDASVVERAQSLARGYASIGGNNCVHGMILYCYLRAILFSEALPRSGSMNINTVVNMRRYLFSSETSPSVFVSSFPINVSVEGLLSHQENCGTIQRRVTDNLKRGLPLAILLGKASVPVPEDCVELELSNLGLHPTNCFTRQLITQVIYNKTESASISVVSWMDIEGQMHFCITSCEKYFNRARLPVFGDELVHQVFEMSVI